MEREHREWVLDAARFPDPDNPFERALRERGWHAPREMLADPGLASVAREYRDHDLLVCWLGDGQPAERPGWVAHSVTHRDVSGQAVMISGTALAAGR